MSENALQTAQQFIQDVLAPDVRELKVRMCVLEKQVESLQKYMDIRFNLLDQKNDAQFKALDQKSDAQFKALDQKSDAQFKAFDQKSDAQFKALIAAIQESRAQAELSSMRVVANLSERVAVLEAQRH